MKKIIIIGIILSFLMIAPSTLGIPANHIKLDDFDDYNLGDTSGSNSYISWERLDGDEFTIQGSPIGNKYIKLDYSGVDRGFINCSTNNSGYYVKTDGYTSDGYHSGGQYTHFLYKNTTTNKTLVWLKRKDHSNAGTNNKFIYRRGSTDYTIYSGFTRGEEYYIAWNYYNGNVIMFYIYDENWNLIQQMGGTGYNISEQGKTNYTIDGLYIYNQFYGTGYPAYQAYSYVDEVGYIDQDLFGGTGYPELLGVTIRTFTNGIWYSDIPDLCLGSNSMINITAVGDIGARMCISICNDTETFLWVCSLQPYYHFYYTANYIGNFTINVIDPLYYPEGFEMEHNFSIIDCGMPNYTEYGQFYAEFYTDGSVCYYIDNDFPILIYKFNDSTNFSTIDGKYYVDIYRTWALDTEVVWSRLMDHGDESFYFPVQNIELYNQFEYQIKIWNVTKTSGEYTRDEVIKHSNVMSPCQDLDEDGIPDIFDDDIDIGGEEQTTDETDLKILVGLGVCIGLGALLTIITETPTLFFAGFAVTAFALSTESLGYLQMFPTEVGYGLIVVMVLAGAVIWLLGN